MNKIVQDLKTEIKAIKKTQIEGILEMENLGKLTGTTNHQQNAKDRRENLRRRRYNKRNTRRGQRKC